MNVPAPFDVTESLPDATTVLEASAGTGKTYAIVGLAARQLADGVPISRMLLVTFSRAATAELRERMRERVRGLLDRLADPEAARSSPDPLERLLATGTEDAVRSRRDNLVRALSDFDASTIATTHTFCNRMLETLGFLGEREMVYQIVEEVDDLTDEAALDLYLRGFSASDAPEFTFEQATNIARSAVRQPAVTLAPDPTELDTGRAAGRVAGMRVRFATKVREIVESRKRTSRLRTYDDLQTILHRIITDKDVGEAACRRIRNSFDVALVDEFQDTDPLQWEILRRCFHGTRTLILVGDPKQSIYGFRGAEVLSYLSAVRSADTLRVLDTNRRSDGALVSALSTLYGGATLGHPDIVVRPVEAAFSGSRLHSAASAVCPLRIRVFTRQDFSSLNSFGVPSAPNARKSVIVDVADDITATLTAGLTIEVEGERRPVEPGDIAVLVRSNKTIEPLQAELAQRGVNAVIGSGSTVFQTIAAQHWLWVLRAIEQPSRPDRVRLAALTPLLGWTPQRLAHDAEAGTAELGSEFAALGHLLTQVGFAAMAQRLIAAQQVSARVLGIHNGERLLTDLLQVSALCNRHVVESGEGISGLVEWLTDRIADTSRRQRHEDQSRRLDRDTDAVAIMTVHASKGLQFPIVYAPFGWDGTWIDDDGDLTYHDDDGDRMLDVGGPAAPGRNDRRARYASEVAGEDLRLLYVALTRAQSQAVLWWAPTATTPTGPLHRLIFGRADAGRDDDGHTTEPTWTVAQSVDVPDDHQCVAVIRELAQRNPLIEVSPAGRPTGVERLPDADAEPEPDLAVAAFERPIDQEWRRTSYSAIVAAVGHADVPAPIPHGSAQVQAAIQTGSETDGARLDTALDDEPVAADLDYTAEPEFADTTALPGTPSPMSGLPFGASFGTLVHEVLEYVDTSAPDMRAHVRELCARSADVRGGAVDLDVLANALSGVLTTPLGFGDLWSIKPRNRLSELDFELPLGSGETADGGTTVGAIADLMRRHLAADDPLRPYCEVLGQLPRHRLRGYLTGSIDSVLRTPDGRFVVVDYKTNRLRPGDLVVEDFDSDAMAAEMIKSHYPLQALLYSVALHRYLRWRLADYRPADHLGPVQYHFVRGMAGPDTPPGCGVFEWKPAVQLITDISDALAGDR
ncbi:MULTISPECIES: UvrD-helicase domain-containing protein [unclassified Gordonia (in: high G+C Gram-positive bacteria)]|uniref:UvrD-helicase domain-containing protein n=1 Tax=Gordonia sp. B7-2 TaxID=3420932 RepID=UPI003D8DCA08